MSAIVAVFFVSVLLAGCSDDGQLGPPTPTGATDIGGPPMTSEPPPPPGWNPKDVVPQSQQQAQDTLAGYLQRTLKALPPGTTLDASRFGGVGSGNIGCDDDATSPDAPARFDAAGDLTVPPDTDYAALIRPWATCGAVGAGMSTSVTDSASRISSASVLTAIVCGLLPLPGTDTRPASRDQRPAFRVTLPATMFRSRMFSRLIEKTCRRRGDASNGQLRHANPSAA